VLRCPGGCKQQKATVLVVSLLIFVVRELDVYRVHQLPLFIFTEQMPDFLPFG
jgi:hypothetical protein